MYLIHFFIHLYIHLFIHPSIHSSIDPSIHSFIHLFVHLVTATSSTNYNYHYFYNGDETSTFVFIDERLPKQSSSPGWVENPKNIETTVGNYIYFNCRNKLSNNRTVWLLDGREDIFFTKYAPRVKLQSNGKTIRFGPMRREDNGIGINCEVWTKFGVLPSPLGTIYVLSEYIILL